jgi:hypothetical protein
MLHVALHTIQSCVEQHSYFPQNDGRHRCTHRVFSVESLPQLAGRPPVNQLAWRSILVGSSRSPKEGGRGPGKGVWASDLQQQQQQRQQQQQQQQFVSL